MICSTVGWKSCGDHPVRSGVGDAKRCAGFVGGVGREGEDGRVEGKAVFGICARFCAGKVDAISSLQRLVSSDSSQCRVVGKKTLNLVTPSPTASTSPVPSPPGV